MGVRGAPRAYGLENARRHARHMPERVEQADNFASTLFAMAAQVVATLVRPFWI